jgi:hypothetical protein
MKENKSDHFTCPAKRQILSFFLFMLLLGTIPVRTYAQVTINSTASATIVTVIAMTKTYDLDFGNLAVTTVGGTCILAPVSGNNPTRTVTGGVTLPAFHGTPRAAEFTVTGVPSQLFTINIPSANLTITSGANTMTVNTYTTDQTVVTPGTSWYGTLGTSGTTFHVGGTVNVAANQAAGLYQNLTGFPVTVNYQ